MTAMSREEVLTRYRRLREISKRHQTEAVRYVPHSALLDQARRIGLAVGKTLVAESFDYVGATVIAAIMLIASFVLLLAINLLQGWTRSRQGG
jgi:hypothetical protein